MVYDHACNILNETISTSTFKEMSDERIDRYFNNRLENFVKYYSCMQIKFFYNM